LFDAKRFAYQQPDEYRLDKQLEEISAQLEVPIKTYDTEHFLTTRHELKTFMKERNL
jgi:deoxyribodipyrimidine photolyase-related protein